MLRLEAPTGMKSIRFKFAFLAAAWSASVLILSCCSALDLRPAESGMSPMPILVEEDAWARAERIASEVPGGEVFVGHGEGMIPLYPNGTILVLQPLEWESIRAGMTVVVVVNSAFPMITASGVTVEMTANGRWVLQGLANSVPFQVTLGPENYVGTVVAALEDPAISQIPFNREALASSTAFCTIRCHIGGETHPLVVPQGLLPDVFRSDGLAADYRDRRGDTGRAIRSFASRNEGWWTRSGSN
jgi:CTP:molybdopterin cytidylyltransferase MocA